MRFDWTDEKLQVLSQEQLLNLLDKFHQQLAIGRLSQDVASELARAPDVALSVPVMTVHRQCPHA